MANISYEFQCENAGCVVVWILRWGKIWIRILFVWC